MKPRRFYEAVTATLLAVLIGAVLAAPAMAQGNSGKNKDKDDGGTEEPVELPPIEYQVQLFEFPADGSGSIFGANNLGQVVGFNFNRATNGYRAWLFDATLDPQQAVDLNSLPIKGVPDGYVIGAALDINDWGFAVGFLQLDGDETTESRRGYVLDTITWSMQTFPEEEEPAHSFALKINEDNLVLGGYDWFNEDGFRIHEGFYLYYPIEQSFMFPDIEGISNRSMDLNNSLEGRPAQVAGHERGSVSAPKNMLRLTLPDALEVIDLHEDATSTTFAAMNDAGTMCGHISFDISTHPRKREIVTYPFRYNQSLELLPVPPSGGGGAFDINSAGDIVTSYHVYHDDWGYVSPDDVLIGSPETMERWFAGRGEIKLLGDRNASDFGLLVGTLYESDGSAGFVLVPVPVE